MAKKGIVTEIVQHNVKVLDKDSWKDYEKNRPGKEWELVEFIGVKNEKNKPYRAWVPNYTLAYKEITDHSKVKIVNK